MVKADDNLLKLLTCDALTKTNIAMIYHKEPILEPKTQGFVDSTRKGWQTLYTLSYAEAREVLEGAQAKEMEKLPADIEDKILPVGPTGEVSVRIYRPKGAKGNLPVVMYFHGGGCRFIGWKQKHA